MAAGNSTKVVEFLHGSTYMKAVLVEEAPDEEALCWLCRYPLHGLPFYTTQIFDVHLRCAEDYCFFLQGQGQGHGQEKSSSPAPANHHNKHDKQLAGRFQYHWQPQHDDRYGNVLYHAQLPSDPLFHHHPNPNWQPQPNVCGNVSHAQPMNFSCYQHRPYYNQQPPNPWQLPQHNVVYGNVYQAQPLGFNSYQPPPDHFYHHPIPIPNYYVYEQPPNPSFPPQPVSHDQYSYSYRPPASASASASINQQAAGDNQGPRPTKWGTSAAVMLGSSALSAFLQVLFGIILG